MAVILPTGWSDFEIAECCVDTTERGQRILVEEQRFTNNFNNTRTSWGYISPTEELYTLVADASCGGGNANYPACTQINHFTAAGLPFEIIPPFGLQDAWPAVNCVLGTSDEPVFSFTNSTFRRAYFPLRGESIDFDSPSPPFGNFNTFAKQGNNFYGLDAHFGGGDPSHHIWAWNMDGDFLWESNVIQNYFQNNASVTASFIYAMITRDAGAETPVMGVAKLNRNDGSKIAVFDLDNISPLALFTVNDNLIYILCATGAFYYLKNFTDLIFVGRFPPTLAPLGAYTGFFTNGRFYYGGMGASGFSTHIYSITLPCPEGAPLIASVSTTTSTVAAGASIMVDWDDVLEPHINDRLYLKANDGVLFDTTPLSNQQPNVGTEDGSFSFTIPGGTAPGSYVIQFVSRNAYLVATSAPFTVT